MKTVYILGAGFSFDAGAPTQAQLMQKTFEFYNKDKSNFEKTKFLKFKNFLENRLYIDESNFNDVALEDIFTPLDSCLSNNAQYRGLGVGDIIELREAVFYVVSKTIQLVLNNTDKDKLYIEKFAEYLVEQSKNRKNSNYRNSDPVSVISTNWDVLLDNALYKYININYRSQAVVDYCCYISSLQKDDETVKPGLEMLGKGGFNTKLIKLHGSLNWLQCSRCMRLYVGFNIESGINLNTTDSCRHCDTNFNEENGNHRLSPNLIMPTFIKDLSNPQYKIIWQNAGIEISEADKIVFIGYSLPSADFEMRQLLSRMTRKNAKIDVVDFCAIDNLSLKSEKEKQWKSFFGNREVKFHFDGASEYIKTIEQR